MLNNYRFPPMQALHRPLPTSKKVPEDAPTIIHHNYVSYSLLSGSSSLTHGGAVVSSLIVAGSFRVVASTVVSDDDDVG